MALTDWTKFIKWSDTQAESVAVNRVMSNYSIKDVVNMDFSKVSNGVLRDVATLLVVSDYKGEIAEALGYENIHRLKGKVHAEFVKRLGQVGELFEYAYSMTSREDGWAGAVGPGILSYSKAKPYCAMDALNKSVRAIHYVGKQLDNNLILELWKTQNRYTKGIFGEAHSDEEYINVNNYIDLVIDNKFEEAYNKYFK